MAAGHPGHQFPWRAKRCGLHAKSTAAEGGHGGDKAGRTDSPRKRRSCGWCSTTGITLPKSHRLRSDVGSRVGTDSPPALPVVPLLFPTTCHFWERWMGRCWPGSLPTSPPPPHVPVGASTKPPQPLGHPALPPPPPRVAGVPISGDGWGDRGDPGGTGRCGRGGCRSCQPHDWRGVGGDTNATAETGPRLPEGPRMSSGFTHDHLTAAAAALPTGTR